MVIHAYKDFLLAVAVVNVYVKHSPNLFETFRKCVQHIEKIFNEKKKFRVSNFIKDQNR